MIPIGQQVCDLVRSLLGDTEVSGGQIFKNAYLYGADTGATAPFTNKGGPMQSAYDWLFERMYTFNDRRSRRTSFALINPNISHITPATIGLTNLGNPIDIWERGSTTSWAPSTAAATPASPGVDPFVRLGIAHGGTLHSGQTVETYLFLGIDDSINDTWTINVPDSSHIDLMGCTAVGTWTNPSGLVIYSSEVWPTGPMRRVWDLLQTQPPTTPVASFGLWEWETGYIRVPAVTTPREIRMNYNLSGAIPLDPSLSLGVDDILNLMAYRVAAIAGGSKGNTVADALWSQSEAYMTEYLRPVTKDLQRERLIAPRYRQKRNTGISIPY